MARYDLRLKARDMRSRGESVNVIARELGVSKSTSSLWVRDIILSVEQLQKLRKNTFDSGEIGRLKGAFLQKTRRIEKQKKYSKEGIKRFSNMTNDEFFVAGVALYWAEGSKKHKAVQLCNSDPKMINFFLRWLKSFFNVELNRVSARVSINESHKDREQIVKEFWSNQTKIPLTQFRKTIFKKTKSKKVYENRNEHFGVFDVYVLKPSEIYYKILGLVEGLAA